MGTDVKKFAKDYTPTDFAYYFKEKIIGKKYPISVFMNPFVQGAKRVGTYFDNNWEALVVTLDWIFDNPPFGSNPSYSWLTGRVFEIAMEQQGHPNWKYAYYKRFREDEHELRRYNYALGLLESCSGTDTGGFIRIQISGESEPRKCSIIDVREKSQKVLDDMIELFQSRMKERGYTVEWPNIEREKGDESLIEFINHPDRANLLIEKR